MFEQKFLGQLNSDDADRDLKDDIRDCLNLIPQKNGRGQSPRRESLKGTLNRFSDLPTGTNKTVGQFSDKNNRQVFFFNYNSNGNHGVYCYDGNTTYKLLETSLLNFTERTVISGAGVIDKTLIWTDGVNPIRSIDFERAINTYQSAKIKKWEIIVDRSILVGSVPIIRVSSDLTGDSVYNLSTPSSESDIDTKIDYWVTQLSANNELVVERCGDNIEISESGSSNISSITSEAIVEVCALNHYILPITEWEITFGNKPPLCEPSFEYITDTTRKANLVKNKQFQFRTRYVYFDNSKSVLSPISTLAFNRSCLDTSNSGNGIEVTFSDTQHNQRELTLIKNVEVFFREGNLGAWYMADSLSRGEYFLGKYQFFNDGVYQILDDASANKNYDNIPLTSNGLTAIKNRVMVGGNLEGYDTPCIEADVEVDIDDLDLTVEDNTWTIEGYIRIASLFLSDADYRNSQPIWEETGDAVPSFGGIGTISYVSGAGSNFKQYIPQGGFTVYLAGTQYRATSKQIYDQSGSSNDLTLAPYIYNFDSGNRGDVRSLINDRQVYSKFSITGIKPGRYILRVASHNCYEGNTPTEISDPSGIYQINNTLTWQQTSTNIIYMNTPISNTTDYQTNLLQSDVVTNFGDTEIELELGVAGGTYNISDETNTVITIADLTDGSLLDTAVANQIYVRDLDILQKESIVSSKSVEKSFIEIGKGILNQYATQIITDHNGYSYFSAPSNGTTIAGLSILRPRAVSGENELKGFGDNTLLRGYNLSNVFDGSAGLATADSDLSSQTGTEEFIMMAKDTTVREYSRTLIKGTITSNGQIIPGILVVASGTNSSDLTDSLGNYTIRVFSESDSTATTKTRDVTLFVNTPDIDCLIDANRFETLRKDTFTISDIGSDVGDYNNTTYYEPIDFALTGITNIATLSYLKRGGTYQFGILYYDDYLRASLVSTLPRLRKYIPFYTEDLSETLPDLYNTPTYKYGNAVISWEIRHQAPSWATKYRWVRTKNTLQENYLTWLVDRITYVINYAPQGIQRDGTFSEEDIFDTTYSNGDANEIHLNLDNIVVYNGNNPNSKIGYTYNDGDRVIIVKNNGLYLTDYYDLEIKGYVSNSIVIENIGTLPELRGEVEIQIYSPKAKTEQQFYYEFGRCYNIINGYHQGDSGLQTSVTPAVGTFGSGDTYKVGRLINVGTDIFKGTSNTYGTSYSVVQDHHSIADSIDTKDQSIGRVSLVSNDFKQQFFFSAVRFSNPFVQNTFINGIKSFDANDVEYLPNERGIIRALAQAVDVVLAIHETETTSLYLGEQYLNSPDGSGILTQTDSFIGTEKLLKGKLGTRNPESIVEWDDNVFYYDSDKAEPVMYSINGLESLATIGKMRNFFRDMQKSREEHLIATPNDYSRVYGGYNPENNMFVLSFNDMTNFEGETLGWNDQVNYWVSRFSFRPQFFSKLVNRYFSFKDGEMWEHDVDSNNYNNFYGTFYPISYKLISNEQDVFEKIYRSLAVKTNAKFTVPSITNRDGQFTDLVKTDLVRRDDMYYANILRDKNTPIDTLRVGQTPLLHGEVMRSQLMEFEFESDEEQYIYIEYIGLEMQLSPGHLLGLRRE